MISSVSQPVGTNVRIYLDCLKGKKVKYGKGKARKRNVSFKGKIHEIRRDCVILKGNFVWSGFIVQFGKTFKIKEKRTYQKPKLMCRKFLLSDIMRIMKIELVTA